MSKPTLKKDRIQEIDGVRAVSLFGILMMNITAFAGDSALSGYDAPQYNEGINGYVTWFIHTFFTSSFFTMFSFLFGLSFYIFITNAKRKSKNAEVIFVRRLIVLLIIGLIHGIFIWYGDILTVYAIGGFFLLMFIMFKPKTNLWLSIITLAMLTLATLVLIAITVMFNSNIEAFVEVETTTNSMLYNAMHMGSYSDLIITNGILYLSTLVSGILVLPIVLSMFLLGLYTGQTNIYKAIPQNKKLIKTVMIVGLCIGLPLKAYIGYTMTFDTDLLSYFVMMLSYTIAGPLTSLGYIALFTLIFHKSKSLLKIFQPVGQMALTHYLMQSVIMVTFFKVTGLFGTLDAVWFIPIVIILFTIQILMSHIWMNVFKYGPVEYVWRMLTYLKVFSIR